MDQYEDDVAFVETAARSSAPSYIDELHHGQYIEDFGFHYPTRDLYAIDEEMGDLLGDTSTPASIRATDRHRRLFVYQLGLDKALSLLKEILSHICSSSSAFSGAHRAADSQQFGSFGMPDPSFPQHQNFENEHEETQYLKSGFAERDQLMQQQQRRAPMHRPVPTRPVFDAFGFPRTSQSNAAAILRPGTATKISRGRKEEPRAINRAVTPDLDEAFDAEEEAEFDQAMLQAEGRLMSFQGRATQHNRANHSVEAGYVNAVPPQSVGKNKIPLKPVHALPDIYLRYFQLIACLFIKLYHSDINVVVSAPTGAGKTVLFELAILRLFSNTSEPEAKVVYMAPTKSLCTERANDWKDKFHRLGLGWAVVELTGDTSTGPDVWRNVKKAKLIITTPEKWDSVTRKWHDHHSTLTQFRLLCVDECHSVGMDVRGATLEVVVSRMKTLATRTRFVAASATVPNIADVAEWLGEHPESSSPAKTFSFGDEFRPCLLEKIVIGYPSGKNDFSFSTSLDNKLFDLIRQYSSGKPVLIFCNTRKGCVSAAEAVSKCYEESGNDQLPWPKPKTFSGAQTSDRKLGTMLTSGVAFHHAGLDLADRRLVEQAFSSSKISIVCATSTLAVGVNLPARMVIIKGTKTYRNTQMENLTDMEILQMIGRAGRPQFDRNGVAVIMTESVDKAHYDALVNARDPVYYSLIGFEGSPDARLESLCLTAIEDLEQHGIIHKDDESITATPFGQMMARSFLSKSTFVSIKELPQKSGMRTLLETIAGAAEFREIRFRQGEKPLLSKVNKDLKFPVAKLVTAADKIMVLVQVTLQGIASNDLKTDAVNPMQDASHIWPHVVRMAKCIVDILLDRRDGGLRTAMELMRSVAARAWDNSAFVLRQLDRIGEKSVKALADRGITSLDQLRQTQPNVIELAVGRNPPFGLKLIAQAKLIPNFTIELASENLEVVENEGVHVTITVKVSVVQTQPLCMTKKGPMPLFAMILIVTSDSEYIEALEAKASDATPRFRRIRIDSLLSSGPKSFSVSTMLSDDGFGDALDEETERLLQLAESKTSSSKKKVARIPAQSGSSAVSVPVNVRGSTTASVEVGGPAVVTTPRRRPDGKFLCNHACKDKTSCRHLCCQQGLEKPPAAPRRKKNSNSNDDNKRSSKISMSNSNKTSAVTAKKTKVLQTLDDLTKNANLPPRKPALRLPSQPSVKSGEQTKLSTFGNRTLDEMLLPFLDLEAKVAGDDADIDELDSDSDDEMRSFVVTEVSKEQTAAAANASPTSQQAGNVGEEDDDGTSSLALDSDSLPDPSLYIGNKRFLTSSSESDHDDARHKQNAPVVKRRPPLKRKPIALSSDEEKNFSNDSPRNFEAQTKNIIIESSSQQDQPDREIEDCAAERQPGDGQPALFSPSSPHRAPGWIETDAFDQLQVDDCSAQSSSAHPMAEQMHQTDDAMSVAALEQERPAGPNEDKASMGEREQMQNSDDEFDEWLKSSVIII
ncbi:ATP-dependent DNA helicase MER3 [Microbotryomycetes sp. JL221]|nr:ATP-dependent DNA helicase MER3 [Microbotryomycetes sp. JL221]